MIVGVSFTDTLKIPEFSGKTQFDLLPKGMDDAVAKYHYHLGADITKPVIVQACKHRTLDGEVVIGYRHVWFERTDREWFHNPRSSLSARIESQTDIDFRHELQAMSAQGINLAESVKAAYRDADTPHVDQILEDYGQIEQDMKTMITLAKVQAEVRGPLNIDENMFGEGTN